MSRSTWARRAGFATAPMKGAYVKQVAVPGTLTQALEIGRTIMDARAKRHNVVERLLAKTGATLFFTGKVADVRRELRGGFAMGEARLTGLGEHAGAEARIAIQNENLVLWVDGVAEAIVPDLIMNLELETGEPITTEMLRYGQQLAVIGIPAHDLMKTPRGAEGRRPEGVRLSRARVCSVGVVEVTRSSKRFDRHCERQRSKPD